MSWSEIGRYVATGYGNWDFVRPEVFQQLVADGVLEHVPPPRGLEESINQVYRIVYSPQVSTGQGASFRESRSE